MLQVHDPILFEPTADRLEYARQIVRAEAAALERVAQRLDASFLQAIDLFYQGTGRIAVTGTGKSADVGQKIAGTLNSTGSRAYVLDATRAMHGDLGMVHPTDVILALSHSGESEEIVRLLGPLRLGVPILCTLQGDDIYLEALPEPYRSQCLDLIRQHCQEIDGFIATSIYYADFMTDYFKIPRARIHVVYPGLNLAGHGGPRPPSNGRPHTVGYFARICPEKGLHTLAEAFRILRQMPGAPPCRLRVSGWLGENQRLYMNGIQQRLKEAGLAEDFEHIESPDHASKVRFLQSLDVLSVPTSYREPKGLYVLEALANAVPVVQPRHGSFPELIEATGGGVLVNPEDPEDLARSLRQLLDNVAHRDELGRKGKEAVHQRFHAARMAQETVKIYQDHLQ